MFMVLARYGEEAGMSNQKLDVVSKVDGREPDSGRSVGVAARRVVVVVSLVVALLLGVASVASATETSSFYWYGNGNSTCWQTGQLGSPSENCDSVAGEYLSQAGHMRNDHSGSALAYNVTPSGDYCGAYELGDYKLGAIGKPDATNQGPATGFTTGVPYQAFQVSDENGSACQAEAASWGQEVRAGAPESGC
jgi:hypothetical protein